MRIRAKVRRLGGHWMALPERRAIVGRSQGADCQVGEDDDQVSPRHLRVTREGRDVMLITNISPNGMRVDAGDDNWVPIPEAEVGDRVVRVQIGRDTTLEFGVEYLDDTQRTWREFNPSFRTTQLRNP